MYSSLLPPFFDTGRSQRFPLMSLLSLKLLIVSRQWFVHPLHVVFVTLWLNSSSSSFERIVLSVLPSLSACFFAWRAEPKAPIRPAMLGLMTSCPISSSKARSTASFRNVPPWQTMFCPRESALDALITLYMAFLTTEMARPAEMSSIDAPSFWACLTEEFMNTVHLEPSSTGALASIARRAKSETLTPIAAAKV